MLRPELKLEGLPELEALLTRNQRPTAAQIAEFHAHANALFKSRDPSTGWIVLAALAAAQWDIAEVRSLIRRSLQAVGNLPQHLANIAVTFEHLELPEEGAEYSSRAHSADPSNPEWTHLYTSELFSSGQVSKAIKICEDFINRGEHSALSETCSQYRAALHDLTSAGIDESRLASELAIARAVLRENGIRSFSYEFGAENDPTTGDVCFIALLKFCGSLDDEMRLGAEIAARLADSGSWDPCKLNIDVEYSLAEDVHLTA